MGLTHVAMRKFGFLFDIPCGLFHISLFREAQGCNKCWVLRGNVRSSFQVDFAAAAKGGGGEREVEEKRGRGSKARQLRPPTFQASSGQPESHFAQPCHTLSAVCCSTGIVSSNRMAARRACSWPWHPPPPAKLSTSSSSSSSSSSRQHKGSLLRPPASHRSRPLTFSS